MGSRDSRSSYKNVFSCIKRLVFTISFQTYPILSSIVKAGGHRALEECRKLFKNEIWNCTLDNKHVIKELPIFVKTTLPYGKMRLSRDDKIDFNS